MAFKIVLNSGKSIEISDEYRWKIPSSAEMRYKYEIVDKDDKVVGFIHMGNLIGIVPA